MNDTFWKKINYYIGLVPIALIFGVAAVVSGLEIKDLDLWLHLAMGKFIMTNHYIPHVDMLSSTIAGQPWVNHEWLFQVVVYNIFERFGFDGLIKMQTVVVIVTMALLLLLGFNKDKQLTLAYVLFLLYLVYQQRFTIRPDLFSLLFFTVFIFILALHIDKTWSLVVLFVAQTLWTNMHGYFFFGPLFILIGLFSEWIKRHIKLPYEWNETGRLSDDEYRRLKVIFFVVILACFLNPLTFKGAWYPLSVFFSLSGENKIFFEVIEELQKPITRAKLFDVTHFIYYKLFIIISFVSFVFNRRRIDVSAFLFWVVFLIFSLSAARNTAYFAFAAYLVIITNSLNLSYRDIIPIRFIHKKFEYLTLAVMKCLFILWIVQYCNIVASKAYYDFDKYELKKEYGGVSQRNYPDKAVDFLVANKIKGNFFNDFNSGAYLLGRTFPDIKVFIDGRTEVYGAKFFDEYRQILDRGDSKLFEDYAQKFNITGVLLNSARQPIPEIILRYFYENLDWTLVYFDYDGVVFLKNIEQYKNINEKYAIDLAVWKTKTLDLFRLGTINVRGYQNLHRARTLAALGFEQAAIDEAQEALKISPAYGEPYRLMGDIMAKQNRYEQAFNDYRIAAVLSPSDKKARHGLAFAYLQLGQFEKAVQEYQTILRVWPVDAKAHFLIARAFTEKDQYQPALIHIQNAHQLEPQNILDLLSIADVMLGKQAYDWAEKVLLITLESNPNNKQVLQKLVRFYEAVGKQSDAEQYNERVLKLNEKTNPVNN
ncbi:MAG: tetratricopeptide repeat protein [Candidatus Omnitrophica bacterium]|nr:tetratricopeptide repeat protein [Candidatus Omnitrophota bacterium]